MIKITMSNFIQNNNMRFKKKILTYHGENCDISEGDNSEYGYDPG